MPRSTGGTSTAAMAPCPTLVAMSFQLAIPWLVALPQSQPPLQQLLLGKEAPASETMVLQGTGIWSRFSVPQAWGPDQAVPDDLESCPGSRRFARAGSRGSRPHLSRLVGSELCYRFGNEKSKMESREVGMVNLKAAPLSAADSTQMRPP
jgi:hypothetical protein